MSMTRTITNDFLHYLQHRQLNELINLFANDVKWEVPGDVDDIRWLGTRNSKLEIQDLFNTLWQETEPISSKVEKILFDVNDVIIKGVLKFIFPLSAMEVYQKNIAISFLDEELESD